MRNRPGKRERLNAKRDTFQRERASIIAANMAEPRPERPSYGAPAGYRNSTLARDTLKGASSHIGFVGPRGFYTPKDTLSKAEREGGNIGWSRAGRDRKRAQVLASLVKVPE